MRKILSLMMMCLLAVGALHAETYVMADMSGLPTENGDFTLTFGSYTMSMAKNNGTTAPAYNATGLDVRVYAKGSVQLTTTGDAMTQVVFNISTQGKRRQAEITPSTGSVTIDMDAATVTWTGSATDVTFTVGDIGYIPTYCWQPTRGDVRILPSGKYLREGPAGMTGEIHDRLVQSYREITDIIGSAYPVLEK